ncbi:DUF924 domain-containing protein [Aestuariibacter halophilus]|uniref:DUF924 domain-containing protein n=1 Tax=Fluctibacter halophilus TaxID=226011 RepID=A0ABS8GAU4_9ALTE|nr:DUF924 family protein [Aestuariibacter halophilus]MCC2616839.1 DUF924 domain-containing protein [Aestuariibacter halophilus]
MYPDDVLHFWFDTLTPQQWFQVDPEVDKAIHAQFATVHARASMGELWHWREKPEGALAEVLVLDQFSRNMFRNTARAFASDPLALVLAQRMVELQQDQALTERQRGFVYLPYMHSESRAIHDQAVRLYSALGDAEQLEYEYRHKAIIDRFGRYPHRNAILGRNSSAEETAFLETPGSGF